jgi:stage III sporulation protein AD
MDIIKVIAIGIVTVVCVLILRQVKPELSVFAIIAGSIIIIFLILQSVGGIFVQYKQLLQKTGLNSTIFTSVLKVIGVGYLVEFAGDICTDAGVGSISQKILLAGKILILIMCLPVIKNLLEIILEFVPR